MSKNMLRRIAIDDTDSEVQYTGQGWFLDSGSQDSTGDFGPTYQHTLHGTKSDGSFSFNFHGTSISIYGTTNILNITGVIDPQWKCFIDKNSTDAMKPPAPHENGQTLCDKYGLNDGPHELTVNVTTNGQTFWFDNLQYMPSPDASSDNAVVVVDNNDPGLLYSSGWQGLHGIANMTNATGSQVSLSFTGTSLIWRGVIPQELPHNPSSATFSIDGGTPQPFPLVGLPPGGTVTKNHQVFFTTPSLPVGPHVLVVTYTGTDQQTPLTLDYIFVTDASMAGNPGPSSNPSQGSVSTSQPSGKGGPPVGAIVGGIIGGLALMALIIFLLWWRKKNKNPPQDITRRTIEVTPFVSLHTHQSSMTSGHTSKHDHQTQPRINHTSSASTSQSQSASKFQHHERSLVPVQGQHSLVTEDSRNHSSVSQSRYDPSSSASPGTVLSGYNNGAVAQNRVGREHDGTAPEAMHRRVIHQDSGRRLHQERMLVVEDIPPDYTPE